MASSPIKFTTIVPLDEFYAAVTPRDRGLVEMWLNGMVSPYSIAMATVGGKLTKGQYNPNDLYQVFEWLTVPAERAVAVNYMMELAKTLEIYVIPLLHQEGITLDNIRLVNSEEITLSEWNNGYATLTFDVYPNGSTRTIIGTPYPMLQPQTSPVVFTATAGAVYPGEPVYGY